MNSWRILTGDVRETLKSLPDQSVQCVVTSPPYWGLRDYGCEGQIGLEGTPDAFVAALVNVFGDVRNVLADDGVCWLNLGDSYAGVGAQTGGTNSKEHGRRADRMFSGNWRNPKSVGLKEKDLCGIPWRVAFALQSDGWYLRSDIIWSKPNPMPESVTDRPTKAHEYIFLLSKNARYFYDAEAIAEELAESTVFHRASRSVSTIRGIGRGGNKDRNDGGLACGESGSVRNKRSVWHVATQPYPDAHFATYPEVLIEPCILAGSRLGDTVLDPFTGSGTTGAVAIRHQRNFIGCELNPAYVELARKRIGAVSPLFSEEKTA